MRYLWKTKHARVWRLWRRAKVAIQPLVHKEGKAGATHILSSFFRLLFNPGHSWKGFHSPHGVWGPIPPSFSPMSILSSNVPADIHVFHLLHTFPNTLKLTTQSTLVVPDSLEKPSWFDVKNLEPKMLTQPFQWCDLIHHTFMVFDQLVSKSG